MVLTSYYVHYNDLNASHFLSSVSVLRLRTHGAKA